jgi:arylsulfatase A-like enzyme
VEERQWDYYFGYNDAANNYVNPIFKEGRNSKVGEAKQYMGVYPDDLAVDRALSWLESRQSDKPFCLLVWFVAPHEPFFRARRYFDLYSQGTVVPKPATFDDDLKNYPGKPRCFAAAKNKIGTSWEHKSCASLEGMVKDYYAGLAAVDDNIGRILSYLDKESLLDDTAVVYTSDHGFFLGEWRLFDKHLMHEPSIRVPMMLRYPRRIPVGTMRNETVLDIDIAPTILDFAGLPVPSHFQGKSLVPLAHAANPSFRNEWYYHYYQEGEESRKTGAFAPSGTNLSTTRRRTRRNSSFTTWPAIPERKSICTEIRNMQHCNSICGIVCRTWRRRL